MSVSPKLREWNLNTILIAVGLMAALVGWGMTWADTRADLDLVLEMARENRQRIAEIDAGNQRFANLDYRISVEEKATAGITVTLRDVERSFSEMGADIRVMREAVERLSAEGVPRP